MAIAIDVVIVDTVDGFLLFTLLFTRACRADIAPVVAIRLMTHSAITTLAYDAASNRCLLNE